MKGFEPNFFPGLGQHEDLSGVINSLAVEFVNVKTVFVVEVAQPGSTPEDCVGRHPVCHERGKPFDPCEMLIKIEQLNRIGEFLY